MKIKWFALAVILMLVLGGWQAASAAPRPVIVLFDSSLKSITVADAESGTATTTLTWTTAGMTSDYRLTLNVYILDGWKPVYSADSTPLEFTGSRTVTVQSSLIFSPPTYLLSIVSTKSNSIIDQRIVTIPYDSGTKDTPPAVDIFMTSAPNIDGTQLAAGQVQVIVSWSVSNRAPASNLVFEQVFKDGSALPVELPRPYLWIPSTADGPLAPIYPAGEDAVTLRLRVVDLAANKDYASKTIVLPIVNPPAVIPTTPVPVPTTIPVPLPPSNEIISFTANPTTVNPGSAVTLSWEVIGTGGVTIEQTVPTVPGSQVVVNAQSPKGTAQVYLPDYAAYNVMFTLYPAMRTSSAQVQVLVYCPTTFFFGQGDGCPLGASADVPAIYQTFENGLAVWWQTTGEIDIFYNDGTASYFLQQDYAPLPDPVIPQAPPLDRQAPASGFSKVWGNAPDVQAKLGWALADAQNYNARYQGVATARDPKPEFVFYMMLPDGKVIGSGYNLWRKISG